MLEIAGRRVAARVRRVLGWGILALLMYAGDTALGAVPERAVAARAMHVAPRPTPPRDPFAELLAVPASEPDAAKWRRASAEMQADIDELSACDADLDRCSPTARRFLAIVASGRELPGRARLGTVNRAINLAIQATSDTAQHGTADVWSSPLATFRSGKGDCEDYAIAKFAALMLAGVPAQHLRLVIVRKFRAGEAHAVLAAWLDDRWLVLDNRRFLLLEDHQVLAEYRPILAFALESRLTTYAHGEQRRTPSATRTR